MVLPEHYQVHWLLADIVVFIQVVLHHQSQLVHIPNLNVWLGIVLGIHEITEHETAKVIFFHYTILIDIQRFKECIEADVKLLLSDFLQVLDEPLAVRIVHQTVIVNPHDFMDPESFERVWLSYCNGGAQKNSYNSTHISMYITCAFYTGPVYTYVY